MRLSHQLTSLALGLGLAGSLLLTPTSAFAHERRDVGNYQFVVGFIVEPALQGEPNGIDLRITDKATNKPVEGAEKTLKAAIAFGGGQPKEFPLRARFGQQGAYTADVVPTRSGTYIFTFTGDIKDQPVNEKFESGPGRFSDVQPASSLQFPVSEPTSGELQQALNDARAQVQTATTMGMLGLGVGVLALVLSGYLLLTRRQAAPAQAMAPQGSAAE